MMTIFGFTLNLIATFLQSLFSFLFLSAREYLNLADLLDRSGKLVLYLDSCPLWFVAIYCFFKSLSTLVLLMESE
ncbi:hypothetical protein Hanom_Chr03g00270101 [Helianthus anomalus]